MPTGYADIILRIYLLPNIILTLKVSDLKTSGTINFQIRTNLIKQEKCMRASMTCTRWLQNLSQFYLPYTSYQVTIFSTPCIACVVNYSTMKFILANVSDQQKAGFIKISERAEKQTLCLLRLAPYIEHVQTS